MKQYWGCILTNWNDRVMYVGMTNHLARRMMEHRQELLEGFTRKYHVHKLVYYESTTDVKAAIEREKQTKGWTRAKKNALIAEMNPEWRDLRLILALNRKAGSFVVSLLRMTFVWSYMQRSETVAAANFTLQLSS